MKNFKVFALSLFTLTAVTVSAQSQKKIDPSKSTITWVGKKLTGQHDGTVAIKDGALVFKGKKLAGGLVTIDMNSISVTDLEAGKGKEKLEGHLKNDDFFATDKYPTAKLDFKKIVTNSANNYTVTADLTIKGITKPVTFDMTVTGNKAVSKLKIDRTKYDIKYGSGSFFDNLGNNAISDDFDVVATIVF